MSIRRGSLNSLFFKKLATVIPKYKFDNVKQIGEGSRGFAFDIGNDIVLKITDDFSEANASNLVKGKDLKHVNEILDVLWLVEGPYKTDYYLIFQKKLLPLSKKEAETVFTFIDDMGSEAKGFDSFKDISEVTEERIQRYYQHVKEVGSLISGNEKKRLVKLIGFFIGFRNELKALSIRYSDWHVGNIMKDEKGDYKIIDLGYSIAPPTEIPKKIVEGFKKYYKKKFEGA